MAKTLLENHKKNLADKNKAIAFWWGQGFNTFEIAERSKISEAQVYNIMIKWREANHAKSK